MIKVISNNSSGNAFDMTFSTSDTNATGREALRIASDGKVNVGNTTGTNDGQFHILSGATDRSTLIIESPSGNSVNSVEFQYNGTTVGFTRHTASVNYIAIGERALGNDKQGATLFVGRNSHSG